MKKKAAQISKQELQVILQANNLTLKPQYHKEDYIFTSFTMPWPLKRKLDRLAKKNKMTRSGLVQFLIDRVKE